MSFSDRSTRPVPLFAVLLDMYIRLPSLFFFFFNDTATTEIYTLSLHDALPILTSAIGPSVTAKHCMSLLAATFTPGVVSTPNWSVWLIVERSGVHGIALYSL